METLLKSFSSRLPIRLLIVIAALTFTGCAMVGPNYVPPKIPTPGAWHAGMKDGLISASNPITLARWWTTLDDPILTTLMERGVKGNLDLKQAKARVREARAARVVSQSGLYPGINSSGAYTKSRASEERGNGQEVDLYSVNLDSSWELDLFGGIRRGVEAATADLQASQEDLRDVLVSLLAEIALNYVDARTYQTRLWVAEENLKAQQETYDLARSRYKAGLSTELAVEQARYNLEGTRSQIPTLRTGLAGSMNRLAVLLGLQPGAVQSELEQARPIPVPPKQVAVGVPANALRHRPDVRRAERQLAAQTARIGVATAELYPKFNLFGSIGLDAMSFGGLFSAGSRSYSFGPNITWPLFQGGAIRGNIEVQSARQEQALDQYKSTVLSALEEVENALVAYSEEQNRQKTLETSAQAAKNAVNLAEQQYKAGLIDFTGVLDAQRSLLSFQDQLAQSSGAVTSDLVRLYKALGGGWKSFAPAAADMHAEK